MRTPRLTFVSEGKPRRRLRMGLKGVIVIVVVVQHGTPSFLELGLEEGQAGGGGGSALLRTCLHEYLAHIVSNACFGGMVAGNE
jgi:hypothetical protein